MYLHFFPQTLILLKKTNPFLAPSVAVIIVSTSVADTPTCDVTSG